MSGREPASPQSYFNESGNQSQTVVALLCIAVQERPAMRACKSFLCFHDPFFGSQFLPAGQGGHHLLLRNLEWESLDMVAGEISALMTALNALFLCASPDRTGLGELKRFLGPATITGDLVRFCPENRG
jgi:hypothetical protein